ncbi:type VI secretion system transmembrane protein TssO [Sinomicrobium kalidii]|uniref:type VI secretion system TssO n=1 Tax=Sinomicrobium kalidii TaxID=2900738 RepID=UPI001E5F39D1|nr:type VI secretion system TssO [Sinomicrobium kalidii]UGU17167.1 type VI secretion system transmembrane protein TssO [Sinomicrobium kalidii]
MEILNKKERVSAFLLFLLMLVITVGILVFAVFFNYKLPWKENEALKHENDRIMNEFRYQENFSAKIDELTTSIDSLDRAEDGFQFLEQTINLELAKLREGIPADKEVFKQTLLYNNVILNLNDLVKTKRKLQLLRQSEEQIDELKGQVDEYEEIINELKRELELCKRLNRN